MDEADHRSSRIASALAGLATEVGREASLHFDAVGLMSVQVMLAAFARVGVTTENWEQATARPLPGLSPTVRLSIAEVVAILRPLPAGAGPAAVRDALESAIARRSDAPGA